MAREAAELATRRKKNFFKLARLASFPIFGFSILLIADQYIQPDIFFETPQAGWQKVTHRKYSSTVTSYMRTEHFVLTVPNEIHINYDYYAKDKKHLIVAVTPIFKFIKSISIEQDRRVWSLSSLNVIMFLMLLSSAFTMLYREYNMISYGMCYLPLLLAAVIVEQIFI